ncbi:MAG: bifunctional hydroxymethylpyrimidine kinase/phosphomethylpyrimidine kinase [Gammaproteobacteria bacterium]
MWSLADKQLSNRLILGTSQYPSLQILQEAITQSGAQMITVSLRRQLGDNTQSTQNTFWEQIKQLNCHILPNTAGCRTAKEAVMMAEIARDLFETNWIKLEVIGDDYSLQPHPFELLNAARTLIQAGFTVFPYCTEDLVLAQHLYDSGCQILMPWAAPIGSGKGILNPYALETLRLRLPKATLIIDAGIGKPSHAIQVMELGFDGVLLNTAVALAKDPVQMAVSFSDAVKSGRAAYLAGAMAERNCGHPGTPLIDTPFWQQETAVKSEAQPSHPPAQSIAVKPIVWTIAGSDSGGGAGIQADLHTFQALGAYGCSVITAVTAQNSVQVGDIHYVPGESVMKQLALLTQDLPAKAVKLGMLGNPDALAAIAQFLAHFSGQVVLDPVLIASSGNPLFKMDAADYIQHLLQLLPYAAVVTPNIPEAEAITGLPIQNYDDIITAAQKFLTLGAQSVLIKGGHLQNDDYSQDYWTNGQQAFWLACPRQAGNYHGGGCTLSSAIAATLALDYPLPDAIVIAKMYYQQGIQFAAQNKPGKGPAPVNPTYWPQSERNLPLLSEKPLTQIMPASPSCGDTPLGLYPVVDDVSWLKKLLPLGIKTIQLRIKDQQKLQTQIAEAVQLARYHETRLFINDDWELAIQHGAYGVHLGQEDLVTADMDRIKRAGLRLGISTHSYAELATAHTYRPSYVALGPIYPTTSKVMKFAPQGEEKLRQWRRLVDYPLVAIGGIQTQHIAGLLQAGADGVAMISAITQAPQIESSVETMLALCDK